MADVGVRAFKADVSGYLKRAAAGERVRVTSHGRPLVELIPAAPEELDDGWEASIRRLRESGVVTPAQTSSRFLPRRRYTATGSLSDDIVAERDRERRS